MTTLRDLRCDGVRLTGPARGTPCRYLLCRVGVTTIGAMETKCPRCNTIRLWNFTSVVAVST